MACLNIDFTFTLYFYLTNHSRFVPIKANIKEPTIKRYWRGNDPPCHSPNISDQPSAPIYTTHNGSWWETSRPLQLNDFRVVSHWGAHSVYPRLCTALWGEVRGWGMGVGSLCFLGQVCWECSLFLSNAPGITINIISRYTKLSWLLVRWILEKRRELCRPRVCPTDPSASTASTDQ
jgi:hypothetical protein